MRRVDYTLVSETGVKFKVTLTDFLTAEDLATTAAKMEGFRRRTGKDVYPEVPSRQSRDYLIKLGRVFA
jgi:hypothetical protein